MRYMEDSQSIAVVVADNQETILRTVSATLEKAGFTVMATSSASEALRYCREISRPVNLAVIDSEAVGINASDLSSELDTLFPRMQTLILTGDGSDTVLPHMPRPSSRLALMRKPFRRAQLLGHVLEMMDRPKVLTA